MRLNTEELGQRAPLFYRSFNYVLVEEILSMALFAEEVLKRGIVSLAKQLKKPVGQLAHIVVFIILVYFLLNLLHSLLAFLILPNDEDPVEVVFIPPISDLLHLFKALV